jgi:16S rRNA processing protein RimM
LTSAPDRRPRPWRQQSAGAQDTLAADTPPEEALLAVGRIVGVHGVRGEVKMDIYSDRPEEIPKLLRVFLNDDPTPHAITKARQTGTRAVLKLEGINTRDDAETLRGAIVRIRADQLKARDEDAFYHYQLIGLSVYQEDGTPIGTLAEIIETGEVDVYVVRNENGRDQLFPALKDVVLEIDPTANRVVVRPLVYEDA